MIKNYILTYSFLAAFLAYSYIAIYVSRKQGAKIVGWITAIKNGDYTLFLLSIPQIGLIFNVIFTFNNGLYEITSVIAGFIIMILGMGFNIIVRMNLGKNWVPLYKTTSNQELVTQGIYSRVRHPFYLSVLILFLGVAIIPWNIYGLLWVLFALSALIIRIKKEEKELILKFGADYEKYVKETPMIMPKLKL